MCRHSTNMHVQVPKQKLQCSRIGFSNDNESLSIRMPSNFQACRDVSLQRALIVYVPAYSLLHGRVAADLARMRQCHVSRLLHTKHDVTSKGTPQWSLGKRGPQNDAETMTNTTVCPRFFVRTPHENVAVDKPGCCSGYISIAV